MEPEAEKKLSQLSQLIDDLIAGKLQRSKFDKWEIDILLDVDACKSDASTLHKLLRRYRRAVWRQLANGATVPMRLSEFLASKGLKSANS